MIAGRDHSAIPTSAQINRTASAARIGLAARTLEEFFTAEQCSRRAFATACV
jgi:hypothetical protein